MIGKFSIRTVPDQDPEQIVSLTEGYLRKLWSQRGSPNKMIVTGEGERGWLADTNTVNFQAASRFGTHRVFLQLMGEIFTPGIRVAWG